MDWPPAVYDDHEDQRPMRDEAPSRHRRDRFSEVVGDAWESAIRRDPYPVDDPD